MQTKYFTFSCDSPNSGKVIKITDENPREVMFALYGSDWAFGYKNLEDIHPLDKNFVIEMGREDIKKEAKENV